MLFPLTPLGEAYQRPADFADTTDRYQDFKPGDVIEAFGREEVRPTL